MILLDDHTFLFQEIAHGGRPVWVEEMQCLHSSRLFSDPRWSGALSTAAEADSTLLR